MPKKTTPPPKIRLDLCRVLRRIMEQQQVTQKELGRRLGVGQSCIGHKLAGRHAMSMDNFLQTLQALGVGMTLHDVDSTDYVVTTVQLVKVAAPKPLFNDTPDTDRVTIFEN